MKKHGPVVFFLAAVLLGLSMNAPAQTVKIKIEAKSPGILGTIPAGTNPISTGLRIVGKGMPVYLKADTAGGVTTYAWTFGTVPSGSTAAFDKPSEMEVKFTADMVGQYQIFCEVNGGDRDTITVFASTYNGLPTTGLSCGLCHAATKTEWLQTKHATIFTRGISGQLEVEDYEGRTVGVYNTSCIKCHTTGWEPNVDNGNYGFLAKQTGFDTTWYTIGTKVAGEYVIPFGDSTMVNKMWTDYAAVGAVATIGCESCHGPGKDHVTNGGNKTMIGVSNEGGVCIQCHDAPKKHRIGGYWLASNHATMPLSGEEAGRSSCWPCHNGAALKAFVANPTAPDYSKTEIVESISCVACHDPHSDANPAQLRTVTFPGLANGYQAPANVGGMGQLCMNCHRGRQNTNDRIAAQMRVFSDRFYPHYSPQADMFLGANAYEYGLPITGLGTHHGLENACATCHMQTLVNGSSIQPNHQMNMTDAQGNDLVGVCQTCHGKSITTFEDVKAATDYDGNGVIEGVVTEIDGLLAQLKARLPKGANGEPVNMSADFKKDSMSVKADPNFYPGIWNYYFVKNDFSHGIHNTKYAAAILRASLGKLTGVDMTDAGVPSAFALSQNYPNPFNPSTSINFSIPLSADVHLAVYNSNGQLVATLANGSIAPGNYTATWNATDEHGAHVASGMYFYRMVVKNGTQTQTFTKKMVLVK